MKNEQFNPSRTNQQSPQPGMAAVDTNNFDELEVKTDGNRDDMPAEPKNFDREEDANRKQGGTKD
jgi:hypothetical protein